MINENYDYDDSSLDFDKNIIDVLELVDDESNSEKENFFQRLKKVIWDGFN